MLILDGECSPARLSRQREITWVQIADGLFSLRSALVSSLAKGADTASELGATIKTHKPAYEVKPRCLLLSPKYPWAGIARFSMMQIRKKL